MNETVKAEIVKLLDDIEDGNVLLMIKEEIACYKNDVDADEDMTEEDEREINEAIKEIENGQFITLTDFKAKMDKWKDR